MIPSVQDRDIPIANPVRGFLDVYHFRDVANVELDFGVGKCWRWVRLHILENLFSNGGDDAGGSHFGEGLDYAGSYAAAAAVEFV